MIKQRQIGPDMMDENNDSNSAFLDALRTRALDELIEASIEYGIVLKDLAVIDRQFKGDIAATMDKLTTRALQAQVEAANVDRENSNSVKKEQGRLEVARVQAQTRITEADSTAYAVVAAAKAAAEAMGIKAKAEAEATRIAALAEADAIRSRSTADGEVQDGFAREMSARRIEVTRVQAFGNRAVFVPTDAASGSGISSGLAMGLGMAHSK
jgi:regulator of protease activity HflC (stomatin/prohibitin superfamily)